MFTLGDQQRRMRMPKIVESETIEAYRKFLASKDADGLKRLFNPSRLSSVIKVSGMTPAERDTFISERYTNAGLSIDHKEIQT